MRFFLGFNVILVRQEELSPAGAAPGQWSLMALQLSLLAFLTLATSSHSD